MRESVAVVPASSQNLVCRVCHASMRAQTKVRLGDLRQLSGRREGGSAALVVYPAKGLMARDLALVCHYQGLPLVARPGLGPPGSRPSVNALSAAFVEVLQGNVPSAVSTIHRTAARLQVRMWNCSS